MLVLMDRMRMAMADGGLLASSWWLIGRLLRLDVYYFLVRDLANDATASSLGRSQNPEFLKLTSLNDLAKAGPVLRNTLSLHSGRSPDIVINDGGAMGEWTDRAGDSSRRREKRARIQLFEASSKGYAP